MVILTNNENGDSKELVISRKLFEIELTEVHFWRFIFFELQELKSNLLSKKKFCQFRMSESLFPCFLLYSVYAFVPYLRLCANAYVPTYGYLFEKKSSANKKYTQREIDTHYCRQTPSTTPSWVKAYVAQSNPLHF